MVQDVRLAIRTLARSRAFTAAAIATLAIGIGGNAAIFSIVDRVVLRALPFPDSGRLVRLHDSTLAPGGQIYRGNIVPARWDAIARSSRTLAPVTAQRAENLAWVGGERTEPVEAASISAGTLELFGVVPRIGRAFRQEELARGAASGVALISDRFWRTRLGGSAAAIGGPLRLADRTLTVVGVLPKGFRFPYHADVWLPLAVDPTDPRDLLTIARLAPGATLPSARAEMAAIARRLETESAGATRGRGIDVMTLKEDLLRGEDRVPLALMTAVGFLLLLACGNLAALVLSRSVARQREMAVRAALGATPRRQLRPLLAESLLLALAGGGLGLLLAEAAGKALTALVPRVLGEELGFGAAEMGPALVLFVAAVSVLSGLALGIIPAWRSSRSDPAALLQSGGRSASLSTGNRRLLSAFIVGEVALATVLLTGSAVMLQDLARRSRLDLGLNAPGLLSLEIHLGDGTDSSGESAGRRVDRILAAVRRVPGVRAAAASTINPFSGATWGIGVAPEGAASPEDFSTVNFRMVTPGLLAAEGVPLVAGRETADSDREASPPVAVVSRHLARRLWPREPAPGRRILRHTPGGALVAMTVVGIAGDVHDAGELRDAIYLPYRQLSGHTGEETVYVMVRGATDRGAWARDAVRAVSAAEPSVPVAEAEFMDRLYSRSLAQNELGAAVLGGFAAFGLLLSTIGIFGLVTFVSRQRRTEIGIRMALGAAPSRIRSWVRAEGARLAAIGAAIGVGLAIAAHRALVGLLSDAPASGWTPAAVAVLLLAIGTAAADLPARRAARSDPNETLRDEGR